MKPHRTALVCAVFAALLVAAPAAIGSADGDRIINGSPASPGEYPAQGALFINLDADPDFEGLCGGTLVGRRYFLTAAHCVDGESPGDLLVYMGDVELNGTAGVELTVAVIEVHVGYDAPNHLNDLAMLTLATPAPFEPLRVVRANEAARWAGGTPATIIGWGTTEHGTLSNVLLEATVPLITDAHCTSQYGGAFDPNTMVCAFDAVHDTCQGDSGGPLMVPNPAGGFILAGVTSWGIGCADPDFAGIYARLGGAGLNEWVLARHPWTTFAVPPVVHSGSAATFTQSSFHPVPTDAFTTFNWDLDGDGAYDDSLGSTASRTFATAGNQAVGLEATNAVGDRVVSRQIVPVNGTPTAEAGGPYRVPEGGSGTLVGSGVDPETQPLTFTWDLDNNGSFETNGATVRAAARFDGPGGRVAGLRACDVAGACAVDIATINIFNVRPRVRAGPDRRIRRGRRVRVRARVTDPGPDRVRVRWTCGNGRRGTGRTATCRYRRAGRFTIRFTATDDDRGVGTDRVRVRVRR